MKTTIEIPITQKEFEEAKIFTIRKISYQFQKMESGGGYIREIDKNKNTKYHCSINKKHDGKLTTDIEVIGDFIEFKLKFKKQ